MAETRLGVLLWNQASDWPAFGPPPGASTSSATTTLALGPPVHHLRGPEQAIFEGYTALAGSGRRSRAGPPRPARSGANPSATRALVAKDDDDHRPRERWPGDRRNGRSLVRARTHRAGGSSSAAVRPAASLAGGVRRLPCAAVRRQTVTRPGWSLRARRASPLAPAYPAAPADHHRRLGRAEDPADRRQHADMWNAMGEVEFLRHRVDVSAGIARRSVGTPPRSNSAPAASRSSATGWRRAALGGADGPQPDADGRGAARRHVLGRPARAGRREHAERKTSGSTPSSGRWPRPTTKRPSRAGSARSGPWSTRPDARPARGEAKSRPGRSRGRRAAAGAHRRRPAARPPPPRRESRPRSKAQIQGRADRRENGGAAVQGKLINLAPGGELG